MDSEELLAVVSRPVIWEPEPSFPWDAGSGTVGSHRALVFSVHGVERQLAAGECPDGREVPPDTLAPTLPRGSRTCSGKCCQQTSTA